MKRTKLAKSIDDYLAGVVPDARAALERLRRVIRAAAPEAVEVISYRIPAFKYNGMLVGFAAFANHCSFFVMSTAVMKAHPKELRIYDTSAGTIRFSADRPLPATLVKQLVAARIRENQARKAKKRRR